jgi:hypothetical protein
MLEGSAHALAELRRVSSKKRYGPAFCRRLLGWQDGFHFGQNVFKAWPTRRNEFELGDLENQSLTLSNSGVASMEMKQPRKEFSLNRGASKQISISINADGAS